MPRIVAPSSPRFLGLLRRPALLSLALLAVAVGPSCSSPDTAVEVLPPAVPCAAREAAAAMVEARDPRVVVDPRTPEPVRQDLATYLGRLWGRQVTVEVGVPGDDAARDVVYVAASDDARAAIAPPATGYRLVRRDENGRATLAAVAAAPEDLAFAAYALLEELGVRFFHPMQELVPTFDGPRFPSKLDAARTPAMKTRGLHLHTLHPIEYLRSFEEPGEANLAEAKKVVDWLVKTGQNHVQWYRNRSEWGPFGDHARQIVEYAHARGVTVGLVVQTFERASLQSSYVLVKQEGDTELAQIDAAMAEILSVPFDDVELSLGEFLAADPDRMLSWLNRAVERAAAISPSTHVAVHNHVGNYPELNVTYRGKPEYFYQLPAYADPRLGQTVHTLFWWDTFRDGAMYGHTDFRFQRDYMMRALGEGRRVRYFPESAYWISSDVDVPAFLPEYVESRWTDIHGLHAEAKERGLPALDGHVVFSSGHEWGYWLTDYLTAKMLWEPEAPLERFFGHYTSAFGSCSASIDAALAGFVKIQRERLFEKKLIAYVSGEDAHVDAAEGIGHPIRDMRKSFDAVATSSEGDRAAFEADVVAGLEATAAEIVPHEATVDARCRGSDAELAPWCNEMRDGMRIVRLRLEHAAALYRSILLYAKGDVRGAKAKIADAERITSRAAEVIAAREKGYRFDVDRLTAAYQNLTVYEFGYLRQSHTQCTWKRREEQAKRIVDEGLIGSTTGLPSCLE